MDASLPRPGTAGPLRVAYVRGVTPTKWVRIWGERRRDRAIELILTDADQVDVLRDGRAQMAFVRLPVDSSNLNVIPLYRETAVVVTSKDHAAVDVDELVLSDLDGETVYDATGDVDDTFALVAAGVGVAVVPQSIARLHARRDVTSRPVTDAPPTQIALAWLVETDEDAAAIEDFIGIVRGRTARSSRGADAAPSSVESKPQRTERSKRGGVSRGTSRAGQRADRSRKGKPRRH